METELALKNTSFLIPTDGTQREHIDVHEFKWLESGELNRKGRQKESKDRTTQHKDPTNFSGSVVSLFFPSSVFVSFTK